MKLHGVGCTCWWACLTCETPQQNQFTMPLHYAVLGRVAKLKYTFHASATTFENSAWYCAGTKRKFRNCAGTQSAQLAQIALGKSALSVSTTLSALSSSAEKQYHISSEDGCHAVFGRVAKLKYTFHASATTFENSTWYCAGTKRKFKNCAGTQSAQFAFIALGRSALRVSITLSDLPSTAVRMAIMLPTNSGAKPS